MNKPVFLKLGGSLITDKTVEATPRLDVVDRLAAEVAVALSERPGLPLVLGHGSGSFGHTVAHRYQVRTGCSDWRGYAETSAAAQRLNRLVTDAFLQHGVPVVSIQPSASARCRDGVLLSLDTRPVERSLDCGLVPLIYGDVAFDDSWGSTIVSTEDLFAYLAPRLEPRRIILAGEVEGVYSADPHLDPKAVLIPRIDVFHENGQLAGLSGSHGMDVTGGMRTKVDLMASLVRNSPSLEVHLISGVQPGLLTRVLLDANVPVGTRLTA